MVAGGSETPSCISKAIVSSWWPGRSPRLASRHPSRVAPSQSSKCRMAPGCSDKLVPRGRAENQVGDLVLLRVGHCSTFPRTVPSAALAQQRTKGRFLTALVFSVAAQLQLREELWNPAGTSRHCSRRRKRWLSASTRLPTRVVPVALESSFRACGIFRAFARTFWPSTLSSSSLLALPAEGPVEQMELPIGPLPAERNRHRALRENLWHAPGEQRSWAKTA
mmetsp:Transcript_34428/g.89540  ORF Transcript_34428/g.89540 Transcript_34428/m.89540 type:complete len:222 (+) Transcript_34428:1336-2001(+)